MRKLLIGCFLLFCSSAYADEPSKVAENCTMTPPGAGQVVIQCGRYVTIKDKNKITVCNLGEPGTKPVCEERMAEGVGKP